MGRVDERREIIEGLSSDEAWQCPRLVVVDEREHDAALHTDDPPPPVSEGARREVQAICGRYLRPREPEVILHPTGDLLLPMTKVLRLLLLAMLKSMDQHWGEKHRDQPKPGLEYVLGVVNRVRQHPR